MVDNEGFKGFVLKLDPTYILPTRQALKTMVASKYEVTKAKALTGMSEVQSVSLTSDMWTSMNMDVFLAITCHFIDADFKLDRKSVV